MHRILIVDDDEDIRRVLEETLKDWGYETVIAENGEKGLEAFRLGSFSLIITDVRMPGMDGLQMLKQIKKNHSRIPIIVITGYPSVDSAVESLVEGADYYLVKPINFEDLRAKIGKAFEKRKIQRALLSARMIVTALIFSIPIWILIGFLIARWTK